MDDDQRQKYLVDLNTVMQRRIASHQALYQYLKEFSSRLFTAIEAVLAECQVHGVPGLSKSRRLIHPAGGGIEGLQMFIEDWSIVFVPLLGFARPNPEDEARIPPVQFKEDCARIAVFLTDEPEGKSFYDIIIFQDGSWFAWGYGWPKQQSDIESTDFEALAFELVYSFVKDIFTTWNTRDNTSLSTALDTKRHAFEFRLPGESIQGV
ncbi:MAG: hypothetical protein JW966_05520 [Anaerolineae bacterium]|nr:hypothetical protein [Anaerolineae bacterium]